MPIQINIIDNNQGIEFIASGVVTGPEIIGANEKVYTREILSKTRYKMVDRTKCTEYLVSTKEIERLVEQNRAASKINPNLIIAIVAATDLQYGISRMWQAYIDNLGFRTMIFRERKGADEWIRNQLREADKAAQPMISRLHPD